MAALGGGALILAHLAPAAAFAAERTFDYKVTHARYGVIGTYHRTIDQADGVITADSRLHIAVKVLGLVVHREDADQTEVWRGQRLASFESVTKVNGERIEVHGAAQDNRFVVTSPTGVTMAPANVAASDPRSLNQLGPGTVVSIKSGKIFSVTVTGGESAPLLLNGVMTPAHCFHVSTSTQADKWEVWIDAQGVPIRFRSLESGGAVDFTLVSESAPQVSAQADRSSRLASAGSAVTR
jgi:hypothetical protein